MSDKENTYFTVRLGAFNTKSTIDGRVYNIDKEKLESFLQKQVGKPIGEIGVDEIHQFSGELTDRLARVTQIELKNSAGVLRGYDIAEDDGVLIATGHVDFSPALKEQIAIMGDAQPTFGVRALCKASPPNGDCDVMDLICFDYVNPTRRLDKSPE